MNYGNETHIVRALGLTELLAFRLGVGFGGTCQMPIHRLLEHTVFGPSDIEAMSAAYDAALTALGLVDRSDPVTEIVAKKIIKIAQTGELDPARLSKLAIEQLGILVVISPPL